MARLAIMTRISHYMVMSKIEKAGIAELKARLSHYLRVVRSGGSVTVYDRDQPIARIVPVEKSNALVIRPPVPGAGRPGDFRFPAPSRPIKTDIVALLLEDRGKR